MRSDFYVYVLFRNNGEPFYVGKGSGDRWLHHERNWTCKKNPILRGILKQENYNFPKMKVLENVTESEAFVAEMTLIEMLGRKCAGEGPLANITLGGEGFAGVILSAESRARMSASAKLRRHTPASLAKLSAANKGKKLSEEHKEKLSIGKKGKQTWLVAGTKLSEEHKAAISAARKGGSNGWKGKKLSTEHRAKLSAKRRETIARLKAEGIKDPSGKKKNARPTMSKKQKEMYEEAHHGRVKATGAAMRTLEWLVRHKFLTAEGDLIR